MKRAPLTVAVLAMAEREKAATPTTDTEGLVERPFQHRVDDWMFACFGVEISGDKQERADRFIEEALELAQTMPGFDAGRAHALVDYVFSRNTGERSQEVGGVMVTLAALCNAVKINMAEAGETELARVWTKVEQIRAKQAAKPTGSALPVAADRIQSDATRIAELEAKVTSLQFLLARYGDRVRMANAIVPQWQEEIDEALAGRCSKCGGTHPVFKDCMGGPFPSEATLGAKPC